MVQSGALKQDPTHDGSFLGVEGEDQAGASN